MNKNPILITVCGPSLSGKTILAGLLENYGFEELVSTTTRPPRKGELNGVAYNFITKAMFEEKIEQNLFLEHVKFGESYYGVSKEAFDKVISNGKNGVVVVEPEGSKRIAEYCKKNNIKLYQIFIMNEPKVLYERLFERFKNDSLASNAEYAKRAIAMAYEHKNWIDEALNTNIYNNIFKKFDSTNQAEVIHQIIEDVTNILNPIQNNNKVKM